ncbi:anti-sigma factor family protein [Paenibacillus sp. TAB 01]|uniref:anti-sigma factor family protein n=1 Tax=Paenibacillus sp. TAB 01 TaxID=3368988 RepID=UPI0037531B81
MGNHSPNSLCELVKLYALGGLSGEEKASFERHVYQCANCQVHLEELRGLVELLPMASSPIKVPEGAAQACAGTVPARRGAGRSNRLIRRSGAAGGPSAAAPEKRGPGEQSCTGRGH